MLILVVIQRVWHTRTKYQHSLLNEGYLLQICDHHLYFLLIHLSINDGFHEGIGLSDHHRTQLVFRGIPHPPAPSLRVLKCKNQRRTVLRYIAHFLYRSQNSRATLAVIAPPLYAKK